MKNVIIVGVGEVGSAIEKLEREFGNNLILFDEKLPAPQNIPSEIDIMHICIPTIKNFIHIVTDYITTYKPKVTIINSTVKPGTTEFIRDVCKLPVVNSPIRGLHPHLYEGVKTFVKFIGGKEEDCKLAESHFNSLGVKTQTMSAKESEFLKILDTTYYGWNIAFANYVNKICQENGLDYNKVYTIANETYNDGYSKLGKNNVIRPVLYPPKNGIGGHCILNNCILLSSYEPNLCKEILKIGKDSKDPINDKEYLFCEYVTKNKTAMKISKELKTTRQTVLEKLNKFGIVK